MSSKKLRLGAMLFARESLEDIYQNARSTFQRNRSFFDAYSSGSVPADNRSVQMNEEAVLSTSVAPMRSRKSTCSPRAQKQVQEALLANALAHTVTPVEDGSKRTLQAASPDGAALLKFAESLAVILKEHSINRVVLRVSGDITLSYGILAEFLFTSDAKRRGVIVQNQQSKNITRYVKGADTFMFPKGSVQRLAG
ncbi:putative phospholipid-transporting ATPase IIB [Gracilariopsis chorda]|uniref:Putative phospholipid-transporting ATPase IIB n=1 Tax=Gracilariopsis chorda TaxID=448386 RepID=A0A2V3IL26_9FLOR|nr:putative phospholipid-transporting ATPase IIB [Gracilariopsis chorda]|eukprot:PXF42763.1 putative phospholipid-transporting ATPase IIB [Gracilariopsis chorda]